ncbi:hypothetical protein EMIT0P74_10483 [Pseudomonas sp. IT-P74]
MNLRTPRGIRFAASSLTTIASKLAPTEDHIRLTEQHYAETAGLFYARLSVQV